MSHWALPITPAVLVMLVAIIVLVLVLSVLVLVLSIVSPWVRGLLGGAYVSCLEMLAMRLRRNPPGLLIDAYLVLIRRGIRSSIQIVESTYVAHKGESMDASQLAQWVEQRLRNEGPK